jgi:hypothetical protein
MPIDNDGQGTGTKPEPIEIRLNPGQLLRSTVNGFAREIRGWELEDLPRGFIVYREYTPPLELRALDYWLRFGERLLVEQGEQSFWIVVPDIHDILLAFHAEHKDLQGENVQLLWAFFVRSLPPGDGSPLRMQDLLDRFFDLSPAAQAEGILLLRRNYAGGMLAHSFAQPCLDACARILRILPPESKERPFWDKQLQGAETILGQFPAERNRWQAIFDRYYWEEGVVPAPGGPEIIRFLPPAPRVRREDNADVPIINPAPPPLVNLDEDAVQVVPIEVAGRRLAFYRTLGCKRVVRPKKVFGKEEHNYFGYLFRTKKGKWLIVIDCDTFSFAAYIIEIDPNDPFRWIVIVQLPRKELRRIEAARHQPDPPEDEAPGFVGRENHDETFEARMTRLYEEY